MERMNGISVTIYTRMDKMDIALDLYSSIVGRVLSRLQKVRCE